jgi:hypothetical protein
MRSSLLSFWSPSGEKEAFKYRKTSLRAGVVSIVVYKAYEPMDKMYCGYSPLTFKGLVKKHAVMHQSREETR